MKDFEKIYSDYYDTVYRYVLSLCKNETWADDITRDTFLKALKNIDNFRGECKLSVWLCQIAKNTFLTRAKGRRRQVDYPLDTIADDRPLDRQLREKETALQVHGRLHRLGEPYKEVFWMRTFGDLSFKEIGLLFDKSESWARVTYHRAKMKIREGIK